VKQYSFKVIKRSPVLIEGHIAVKAKSLKKAIKKLEKYGDYEVEEVTRVK
jgi:hypothetical protein